jgi:hypothetical protein
MGYQIIWARQGAGVFSSVFQVLGKLKKMELEMSIDKPIVYFNREFLYWDAAGRNGSKNGWEYCFEPLSDIQLSTHLSIPEEKLQVMETITMKYISLGKPEFTFDGGFYEVGREDAARLWPKWIKLNGAMKDKLVRISPQLFNQEEKILGVLAVVSPAKNWEIENILHKDPIAYPSYFTQVDDYLSVWPKAKIFLVTDSQQMVHEALERYGDRLILFPRPRCQGFVIDHLDPTPKLMEDHVIDAYLLSRCNKLIHGISNAASAVIAINPGIERVDLYDED